jgi:SAM-dependent methyltransferase
MRRQHFAQEMVRRLGVTFDLVRFRSVPGWCPICGHATRFVDRWPRNRREGLICWWCRSHARRRHVADVVLRSFPDPRVQHLLAAEHGSVLAGLRIFDAGATGHTRWAFAGLPGYTCAEYWPGVRPGTIVEGVRCEDLHQLTFPRDCFDLLITEDVMEHVRCPDQAWREIRRVLRPNGLHIFTTPLSFDRAKNVPRVEPVGDRDHPLLPPVYHGWGKWEGDRRMLVYNDWGTDLLDHLAAMGLPTRVDRSKDWRRGIVDSYVFISRKGP